MPEPKKEKPPVVSEAEPYWQKIMEATFVDSLQGWYPTPFSKKFYWFLRAFAFEIAALNKTGHPRLINESRFEEICERILPHTHYIDHTSLNFENGRLEKAAEIAIAKDFIPTDYFLPDNEKTFLISIFFGNPKQNLYFTINEGLDGWTSQTSKRIKELQKLILGLFQFSYIPLPEIRVRSNPNTHEEFLILKPDTAEPLFIKIDDNSNSSSFLTESVNQHGEFLQHYALDVKRIVRPLLSKDEKPRSREEFRLALQNSTSPQDILAPQPRTIEELFDMFKEKDILPLTSGDVLSGFAGKTPQNRHEVKQFFAKELAYGWFPEFIERIGPNAKRGFFVTATAS